MYDHVRQLQGTFVPPYYFDSGVYVRIWLLSYGGRPVLREMNEVKSSVLHRDAEPRNVLYDRSSGRCMLVDLMLAEIHARQPLGPINGNGQSRKRKWAPRKHEPDVFAAEVQSLRVSLT
ncbi:hypothetical protein BKA56DRAFT_637925 [Ilyonectria sp. MPI-CAGE-AT-0026]|nr:hypothetical protein BKA56DRAFT_637925 [Ilyonectria sp. MPI-CAGE-AT-0026]